ncbi:MAG: hypothetical protein DRP18_00975 [Candidatus Aenigmatarchaeota archaeon]|nr:MAG: hypothetical protein DRP18_00975 [Candidatus Aenigmarchaeota archaeon]RLJ08751.1 MAG: hypothetical protein DRP16_00750 [Candidatus Aenigmarchaeota archaeon]
MPVERMTALKLKIADITNGEWVRKEGLEPSYVVTPSGEHVSRARILGTVVAKFVADDENFATATIDDGTDTIRAKTFKTLKPLDSVDIGDIVDVIGKVREYAGEIYIIPETVAKITDPNFELLRELELLKKSKTSPVQNKEKEIDKTDVKKELLKLLEKHSEGITYAEILEKMKLPEETLEPVINEVLAEGICYEPVPGKLKKI